MNQFKAGDVVYLKGSRTAATVETAWDDGTVSLLWFEGAVLHRSNGIPVVCLTADKPEAV